MSVKNQRPRIFGDVSSLLNIFSFYTDVAKGADVLYLHGEIVDDVSVAADDLHVFDGAAEGEVEGVDTDGNEIDVMFLWAHSNKVTSLHKDQAFELAEWLDRVGFDINPDDIVPVNYYQAFACECNNYAPILPLKGMSRIEGIYGNIDNPNLYVQKAMRRATCA